MEVFVTADTHFSHNNVIRFENRPFESKEEMDEALIENWNKKVRPNDLVFHLGDVFFCGAQRQKMIADRLHGRKILCRGNHDKGITNGRFRNVLGFEVHNYYIYQNLFLFSHYPQEEAAVKRLVDEGYIVGNVHGHVHSQIEHLNPAYHTCVSTELWDYAPAHIDEIMIKVMRNLPLA